ncbi:hypothetical protein AAT19DRAFT_15408 [Rhodotorula toruloides]|uniref:Uncharacterized protein n=1 Tax=Rhodotorula toruloides TaxID=5286 RepID=A0A2T0A740_RHOTO|nr:hypothetical protein AAT19DRAFT_15408 [Rhodotorula toruloides]
MPRCLAPARRSHRFLLLVPRSASLPRSRSCSHTDTHKHAHSARTGRRSRLCDSRARSAARL